MHDDEAADIGEGVAFIREELRYREMRKGTDAVLCYSRRMERMTGVVTVATVVVMVATIVNVVLWVADKLCH
jgi:hypothetical protein